MNLEKFNDVKQNLFLSMVFCRTDEDPPAIDDNTAQLTDSKDVEPINQPSKLKRCGRVSKLPKVNGRPKPIFEIGGSY